MISTQFIILDKKPYKETAMLVNGISPDCGKLSLVIKKAQSVSGKGEFSGVDLFREFDVTYRDSGSGTLFDAENIELTAAFDGVSDNLRNFKMAGKISSFLLKNLADGVPVPFTYDALRSVLAHLCGVASPAWSLEQCAVVIKMVFLYENGMLPEQQGRQQEFVEALIAAGIECGELPKCNPEYYTSLNNWLNTLIEYNHLER
ncbi:MAG: recombination protein O N-terminal domain-containing protein [Lentisphaeria bacterium]|nr:recombination protein O N-terminal domain-containing protein [Lentisphaeria bacterium]MBQ7396503.1 recombination protein O N-terminal domain-containing protein [Lentisphaeria bacterium]